MAMKWRLAVMKHSCMSHEKHHNSTSNNFYGHAIYRYFIDSLQRRCKKCVARRGPKYGKASSLKYRRNVSWSPASSNHHKEWNDKSSGGENAAADWEAIPLMLFTAGEHAPTAFYDYCHCAMSKNEQYMKHYREALNVFRRVSGARFLMRECQYWYVFDKHVTVMSNYWRADASVYTVIKKLRLDADSINITVWNYCIWEAWNWK